VGKAKRAHHILAECVMVGTALCAFAHSTNYSPFTNFANASA